MRVLEAEAGVDLKRDAAFVAGHSVGEYAALAAAGSLTLADAVRLVRIRGRAMQQAVPVGVGAMAAILGLDAERVAEIAGEAAQGEVCAVANYNSPEQTVIAGHRAAVERASALAKERGAKRALPLPVSAPFHCELMAPARERLAPALRA
jgi:[acyl-carrier-protein] S-malonyltransferase